MKLEDMILVSVDDHVVEPPDMWDGVLTPEWKAKAPKLVHKPDDTDVWLFNGQQIPNVGLNAVSGRPPEEYGMEPTALSQLRPGHYDVDERVRDMNAAGILGSMCFSSVPGFCGQLFARQDDKTLARTMTQAYNDWHIDGWCGAHPGRFIPLALPMLWDPKAMAEEVRRVARKGCHAVTFPDNPVGLGFPSLHNDYWEPFWKACSDEGVIVAIHIGSGTGMNFSEPEAPVEIMIASTPISLFSCATEWVFSNVLRRHPDLRIALSEGGIGWVPYFLERVDYVYEHHHKWTHQDFGGELPSDVFRRHFVTCFIDDAVGVRDRDLVGLETITWECDYPHSDSTWPDAPERLWRSMEGVPKAEVDAMTHLNAMRHFRYDPFAHVPREQATVGALRAQASGVDLSLKSAGGAAPAPADAPFVTIAHVMKQLATAFATPFESDASKPAGGADAAAKAAKHWNVKTK